VVDVAERGGPPLSERSELARCERHGWSEPCFVCDHFMSGEGLGWNERGGDPARLRPGAWCDACAAILARAGSWEAADPPPPLRLVCGGCYDRIRELNRREG
jgi:hypothetical protein